MVARLSLKIAAIALLLVDPARGDWSVTSTLTERGATEGVERRRIVLAESASGANATLDVAVFSTKSATLRVIENSDGAETLAAAMQRERCVAGVNGGYFDPKDAPIGLLISDRRLIAPLRQARLLGGVVSAVGGRVSIQRAAEFSLKSKPTAARQCGPFLVEKGKPIIGLNDTRSARRSFVATSGSERAAIGYCSHVTLAQLGALLATPGIASDLKIQHALNLDGGSSSGFWFKGENGAFSIREQKRVSDYLAIVPR